MKKKLMILLFLVLVNCGYASKKHFKYESRKEKIEFLTEILDKYSEVDNIHLLEEDELFDEWQSILKELEKKAYKDNEVLEQLMEWREIHKELTKGYKEIREDIDDDDDDDDDDDEDDDD